MPETPQTPSNNSYSNLPELSPGKALKAWVVPYIAGTLLAGFVGAPLVWFGLDLPLERSDALRAIALGTVISYAIMLAIDIVSTWVYLYRGERVLHWSLTERVRKFPLFAIIRSLTIHCIGFAIPLILLWKSFFTGLQIPVTITQIGFFLVVSLLMSYVHAIIEFHLLGQTLDRDLGQPAQEISVRLPLSVKIGGIALFVGVVPVALLAETLYLKFNQSGIANGHISHVIGWTFGFTAISIVVSAVLSWLLASDISRASRRLTEGFRRLALGDKKHRVAIATMDEFEELGAGFNTMAAQLEKNEAVYEEFGKLVDPAIRDEVLAGRVNRIGELRYGVVLFCDLVNFTPLSETVTPAELIAYLNDLFDRLVNAISSHGGTVNKFVGDAILAFWNLPLLSNEPELAAVMCAIEMQTAVRHFNIERREWRESHHLPLPEARVGVGIHAGNVIAGTVGTEHRREYTVLGSNVNLASRIQNLSRTAPYEIVISNEVAQHLRKQTETGTLQLQSLGEVALKGVTELQEVWGVILDYR